MKIQSWQDVITAALFLIGVAVLVYLFTNRPESNTLYYQQKIDSLELRIEDKNKRLDSLEVENSLKVEEVTRLKQRKPKIEIRHEKERNILRTLSPDEHIELFTRYTDAYRGQGHALDSASVEDRSSE
jgi:hypothetical protein